VISIERLVDENPRLFSQGSYNQIDPAIVVQVDECRSPLVAESLEVLSHDVGDLGEGCAAAILEHRIVLPRIGCQVIYISICGINIFPAVIVVIQKADTPAGIGSAQTRNSCVS